MTWTFARRYSCPYRTKHRVSRYTEEFYCTITHEPCKFDPRKCPIRRRLENRRTLAEWL